MSCALGLLFLGGFMATRGVTGAAEPDFNQLDAEEDLPDMNYVRTQAEAGRARSQTQLADFYLTVSDHTNAVTWYQKAANQNYVPAQLSLAGCLLAGRGVERNPQAAAQWLRRAADVIDARPAVTNAAPPLAAVKPVTARPETNRVAAVPSSIALAVPAPARTNLPSSGRIQSLLAAEPDLLETPAVPGSPGDIR